MGMYGVELFVPHGTLEKIRRHLDPKCSDDYLGEDETISETAVFPDGNIMDIKCCGSRNSSAWTEAVLFAPAKNGVAYQELSCTDAEEEFVGEWKIERDETTYLVVVKDGGNIEKSYQMAIHG